MDSQDTLWSTLHNVTSIKRQELAKQRDACHSLRAELLKPLEAQSDSRARLRLLLRNAGKRVQNDENDVGRRRKLRASEMIRKKESAQHQEILNLAGISASNVQRFLEQSEHDASITSVFFGATEKRLQEALGALEIKYSYATLFSDLVTERSAQGLDNADYESIGRQEMQDQRKEWESIVFAPLILDESEILKSLSQVFSSPEAVQSLDVLRRDVEKICKDIQQDKIHEAHMRLVVEGLIASDLLSEKQTAVLKEVRNSSTWLNEMADVLNLRLSPIEHWDWQTEAMPLEMRRQLNGKYRVFMQEEITQALLVYHVGICFATSLARILDKFYASPGWKKYSGVGRVDQAKWDYFIGHRYISRSMDSIRQQMSHRYRRDYYMSMLPRNVADGSGGYGDDALTDDEESPNLVTKTVDAKHSLLHLIAAESLLADRLDEELIVLQTDFRWFGPSLSHSTISAVMKFFGVTPIWQSFFKEFLNAPMRFIQDGPHGIVQRRQRGTPMSHILSSFFGEATLFCLDFAVNEVTQGKPMFRMHDDIWLWGTAKETTAAWKALSDLSSVMGIEINEEKTGAARLTRKEAANLQTLPLSLPVGSLHWGLLSVQQDGQFAINQSKIDEHIAEMRRQLTSRKSILDYIKAYNSYIQFFILHFGRPVNALGRTHVDDCLQTLGRIHREICPATNGNVAAHVKSLIKERFKVDDIPDGFIYFPMALGGLELRNPFITYQGMREMILEDPIEVLDEALEGEEVEYRTLFDSFNKSGAFEKTALSDRPTEFLSPQEYAVFRRERSKPLAKAWHELMTKADEEPVEHRDDIKNLVAKMDNQNALNLRDPYWLGVVELYGEEMGQVFGSVQVVERGLLPMGMVEFYKGKVRWDS